MSDPPPPPRTYQVFPHAGPSQQMHWITTAGGNGSIITASDFNVGYDADTRNGNAVLCPCHEQSLHPH
jgi:hypothetical protein